MDEVRDTILRAKAAQKDNILKGFVDDDLEKSHNVGDIHPNGKWVWTQLPSGKYDWRVIKNAASSSSAGKQPAPPSQQTSNPWPAEVAALNKNSDFFRDIYREEKKAVDVYLRARGYSNDGSIESRPEFYFPLSSHGDMDQESFNEMHIRWLKKFYEGIRKIQKHNPAGIMKKGSLKTSGAWPPEVEALTEKSDRSKIIAEKDKVVIAYIQATKQPVNDRTINNVDSRYFGRTRGTMSNKNLIKNIKELYTSIKMIYLSRPHSSYPREY